MSHKISIRVVIEEVVTDFSEEFDGSMYASHIKERFEQTLDAALKLHAARKPQDPKGGK